MSDETRKSPVIKVQRLIADGKHNAFTNLYRWNGELYLTWRKSSGHGMGNGDVMLMKSSDNGETWSQPEKTSFCDDFNYYEGHLCELGDKLFMYSGAYVRADKLDKSEKRQFGTSTQDGKTWSKPVEVYDRGWRFWKPMQLGGKMYVVAYAIDYSKMRSDGSFSGEGWIAKFLESSDGLRWNDVSVISEDFGGSETALIADPDGLMHAFVRLGCMPSHMMEYTALPPYKKWDGPFDCGWNSQGQIVADINGRRFNVGRTRPCGCRYGSIFEDRKTITTSVHVQEHGYWVDYATLPSGGDCSYAGAVGISPDTMLVSYYSQHEYLNDPDFKDLNSPTDIFLAWIKTDSPADWGELTNLGKRALAKLDAGETFDLRKEVVL